MKAAVIRAPNQLHLEEREIPTPASGEVVVEVKACGICGSDLHILDGHHPRATYPRVPGHEFSGVVAAVGEGVSGWKPGDRVCCETNIPCGECKMCQSRMPHLCAKVQVLGFNRDGAFSEFVSNAAENLVELPENMSFIQGAATQPTGVGYHALIERARIRPGETVAVLGAGPVGLGAALIAKSVGARVLLVDTVASRLKIALDMGIDKTVLAGEEDPVEAANDFTSGEGVDCVAEVAGGNQEVTIGWAIKMARRSGTVVQIGTFSKPPAVPLNELRIKEVNLIGSRGQFGTFKACLDLVSQGKIKVDPMISGTVPLEELESQFQRMRGPDKDFVKVLVSFE